MIDNYDSFTYNLVQYFGQAGIEPHVIRNDSKTIEDVIKMSPSGIIISPGPGHPKEAGICVPLLHHLIKQKIHLPVFGVCLGHQAFAEAMGITVHHAPKAMHGKTSCITHAQQSVFKELPSPIDVTRYHSLTVDPEIIHDDVIVTAQIDNIIMGMMHKDLPIHSVQFHPESIATQNGLSMIKNFIEITKC